MERLSEVGARCYKKRMLLEWIPSCLKLEVIRLRMTDTVTFVQDLDDRYRRCVRSWLFGPISYLPLMPVVFACPLHLTLRPATPYLPVHKGLKVEEEVLGTYCLRLDLRLNFG